MKLLFMRIHPLLGAPNKFNVSFDYNKIHPLIGTLIIINLYSSLSSLYYNLTKFWQALETLPFLPKP